MGHSVKTYTRKQAGVIYSAMKRGDIEVPKTVIGEMYDMVGSVEVYNTNDCSYVERFAYAVRNAIDAIFSGDYGMASSTLAKLA